MVNTEKAFFRKKAQESNIGSAFPRGAYNMLKGFSSTQN